jgi:protein O-GlcNAc transferase
MAAKRGRGAPIPELLRQAAAHLQAGRVADATRLYKSVLGVEPRHALALHELSGIAAASGDLARAIELMTRAIDADPGMAQAYANLGNFLRDEGRFDDALNAYRTALRLAPDLADAHRCLLSALVYLPDLDPAQRFAEHVAFGHRHRPPPDQLLPPPAPLDRNPERKLRVGLLSSDLRMHAVVRNLAPLFDHRDRAASALICYAEVAAPDQFTAMARSQADGWRSTVGLGDRAVAELIRGDAIDILIVAAGRFDRNRPLVACYRPAPVQVSLFDAATSGLAEIDYLVTDPVLSPPGGTERFTERLAYLPRLLNFARLPPAPIGALPALARGTIAFGSFNNPAKLNRATIALWAAVLDAVPRSTLTLKYYARYADLGLRTRLRAGFGAAGVDPARLVFVAAADHGAAHLEAYNAIDIGLDATPFPGVHTTYETLWMGVPVVTLAGDTMMARMGAAVVKAAGLDETVATTPDDFVARAAALARDLPRLAGLRAGLRERVARSALCDSPGFARAADALWRTLWRDWCSRAG